MRETDGAKLPAAIEAVWGLRERPQKGPKPGLSLERIIGGAVAIAEAEGIGAVSMNRVAVDLGVTTMALYRYVGSKDELLVLMTDAAFGAPPDLAAEPGGWRVGLTRWCWALLHVQCKHSWMLRIPVNGYPTTPNQLGWLETGLASLGDTPLDEHEKLSVMLTLSGFVRIQATLASDIDDYTRATGTAADDAPASYARVLEKLASPERFPALNAVIASGVMDRHDGPDTEFIFGLERFLDGIELLVREKS